MSNISPQEGTESSCLSEARTSSGLEAKQETREVRKKVDEIESDRRLVFEEGKVIPIRKAVAARGGSMSLKIIREVSGIGSKDIRLLERPWLDESRIEKITVDGVTPL